MSQNTHELLLFFDNSTQYKRCYKLLQLLQTEQYKRADAYEDQLGIEICEFWQDELFNQALTPTPRFIRLQFDTKTALMMPLHLLSELFGLEMRAVAHEVFNSQIGETYQYFYVDDELVSKEAFGNRFKRLPALVDAELSPEEEVEPHACETPISISELISQDEEAEFEGAETVEAILELAKAVNETGKSPQEVLETAASVRALIKGVVHAILFGVITVLLFKGMWLWIGLSVVLLFALPYVYIVLATAELRKELEGDDWDEQDELEGGAAC